MPLPLSGRLTLVAASLALPPAGERCVPAARPVTAPAASPPQALPQKYYLRVNDTLLLVLSRPYCRYRTEAGQGATLWQRAELRGCRGYYQVLRPVPTVPPLYASAGIATGQGVIRLLRWSMLDQRPSCSGLPLTTADFGYLTWDVRYRTWTTLLTADLDELPLADRRATFVGGHHPDQNLTYHLLPYWLTREQARVQRTRHLPPATRLAHYLALSQDTATAYGGLLGPPYRPLLAQLLRAYAACPLPAATARQVAQARQALARAQ